MRALPFLFALALLALAAACGGGERPVESLTAEELVARAYEAMTRTSFSADVPPEPPVPEAGQPPYSIKYGPPDLLLISGAGYEQWPYFFLVGKEVYASGTGKRWTFDPEGSSLAGAHAKRLHNDPRELLRIAINLRDEGTKYLDGKPHRVVAARRDVIKFAEEYLPGPELNLAVTTPPACGACVPPCAECVATLDRQRLEALGYRNPDGQGLRLFKGQDIQVDVSRLPPKKDVLRFTVRGAQELSPALREEFQQVLEAYGADPALLDSAKVEVLNWREQWLVSRTGWSWRQEDVWFWIDPKTFLVTKIEMGPTKTGPTEALSFVGYGKAKLPKPEPAMLREEAEVLHSTIQRRWEPLYKALEAYAEAHGNLYPDQVTPAVLREVLEEEGIAWPLNAFTGEPMEETTEENPGDFHYEPLPDHLAYCAEVYDWYGSPIGQYSPGTEGWKKCLPDGSSP
jgi:hypothetical protein